MDAQELRQRRKAAGLTQAELGARLGLHRDFIGQMERGVQPIAERTSLAISALRADAGPVKVTPKYRLKTTDPMEQEVERALLQADIRYVTDQGGGNPTNLDFYLPDHGVHIEVKRFHSDRIAAQMARAPNVIAAQGKVGVAFLARCIGALATAPRE